MKRRFWRSGHSGARQVWKTSASPIGLASFCDAGHGAANNQGHRRREEFQLGRLVIQWFALRGQPEGALSRGTEMIRVAVCFAFMIGIVVRVSATGAVESEKIENVLSTAGLHAGLRTPGAAVLVVKNGTIAFKRGYGVSSLRTQQPIDARTNFRLASVTKQFTAMAIMLLVHDGKVKYNENLCEIYPDFPVYGRAITIRMLLNHTSGLQDYEDLLPEASIPVEQIQIHDDGVLELLKQQKGTKFPPGSKWAYSNSGYVLLGGIVQKVSGERFADFLRDRIFSPLKMGHTVAYVRGYNAVADRAYGYSLEKGRWTETDQSPTSATLGDGGVYSSVEDLVKWDKALADYSLLSRDEMQAALTPANVPGVEGPDGAPAAYGFGWFLNPYKGH
jgi:CubicO group peptidase (beta-lactamase class C family)